MPSIIEGIDLFLRKDKLNQADWQTLIENRRVRINQFTDSVTLRKLGDISFLGGNSSSHTLRENDPVILGDEELSLDTQGIFSKAISIHTEIKPKETRFNRKFTYMIWGLTRSGEWIICTIQWKIDYGRNDGGFPYEEATDVAMRKTTLTGILEMIPKETAQRISERLYKEVKDWVQNRKDLLRYAENLKGEFDVEETLLINM